MLSSTTTIKALNTDIKEIAPNSLKLSDKLKMQITVFNGVLWRTPHHTNLQQKHVTFASQRYLPSSESTLLLH